MRAIKYDAKRFNPSDMWAVYKWGEDSLVEVGRVLAERTVHLNDRDLDEIARLADFKAQGLKEHVLVNNPSFVGSIGYVGDNFIYMPMTDNYEPICDSCDHDIYVRRFVPSDDFRGYFMSKHHDGCFSWTYRGVYLFGYEMTKKR